MSWGDSHGKTFSAQAEARSRADHPGEKAALPHGDAFRTLRVPGAGRHLPAADLGQKSAKDCSRPGWPAAVPVAFNGFAACAASC